MSQTVDIKTARELRDAGFPQTSINVLNKPGLTFPTAFDILAQMPGATIGMLLNGQWACSWDLPNNYRDWRQDPCPHKAAALAFIAWKEGIKI